jgi:branched-chain amino acid transport system ATP-binding protein
MDNSSVLLDQQDITGLAPHAIVEAGIALVPEGRGIFGDLKVSENLLLGAHARRARHKHARNMEIVMGLFPILAERRNQIASTMSGGEQQMVAIARALMSNPSILMLDEPSLGLSPLLCQELFQTLAQIKDTGVGVFLVEQNAKQSLAIADRGYLLDNGCITGRDSAEALRKDEKVQKAYLGAA